MTYFQIYVTRDDGKEVPMPLEIFDTYEEADARADELYERLVTNWRFRVKSVDVYDRSIDDWQLRTKIVGDYE